MLILYKNLIQCCFISIIWYCEFFQTYAGHSTHFQVGGDNPKIEKGDPTKPV